MTETKKLPENEYKHFIISETCQARNRIIQFKLLFAATSKYASIVVNIQFLPPPLKSNGQKKLSKKVSVKKSSSLLFIVLVAATCKE